MKLLLLLRSELLLLPWVKLLLLRLETLILGLELLSRARLILLEPALVV